MKIQFAIHSLKIKFKYLPPILLMTLLAIVSNQANARAEGIGEVRCLEGCEDTYVNSPRGCYFGPPADQYECMQIAYDNFQECRAHCLSTRRERIQPASE